MMVLKQQHPVPGPGQPVGDGEAAEPGADDNDIVIFFCFIY